MDEPFSNHDLSVLTKKIADRARKDGEISEDEYQILERLSFDVEEYMAFLEKSMSDGKLDDDELEKLHELRKKIAFDAMEIASKDGVVTDEEFSLVNEIVRILRNEAP